MGDMMGTGSEYELLKVFRQLSWEDQQFLIGYAKGRFKGRKERHEEIEKQQRKPIFIGKKSNE